MGRQANLGKALPLNDYRVSQQAMKGRPTKRPGGTWVAPECTFTQLLLDCGWLAFTGETVDQDGARFDKLWEKSVRCKAKEDSEQRGAKPPTRSAGLPLESIHSRLLRIQLESWAIRFQDDGVPVDEDFRGVCHDVRR
jgi:hypothetical protein